VNRELVQQVWKRAEKRCEYCRIPHPQYRLPFQIDHIRARQHGGPTASDNLALACYHCNRHKGPNLAGWDPETQRMVRLFHPRTDRWPEHFEGRGAEIVGKTSIGRVTILVLAMNADDLLLLRVELLAEGISLF
jgi:HNH endonuclease